MSDIFVEGNGQFPTDVRIPIVAVQFASDGTATVTAQGIYAGRSAGIQIRVRGQMKPGIVEDEIDKDAFYDKGVIVTSIGDTTRHLANILSELYSVPIEDAGQLHQLDFTSIALDGDPNDVKSKHLNFKVFHDDDEKLGLYFEMFLHVDMPLAYVRFDEKDGDYRRNIVKAFAALKSDSTQLS